MWRVTKTYLPADDPSDADSVSKAEKLPALNKMLVQLEGKAPAPVLQNFKEFKNSSWKTLNSFLHSGIHAASKHGRGYPLELLLQVLQNSDGLSIITCKQMAALAGDQRSISRADELNAEFCDCLPDAEKSGE